MRQRRILQWVVVGVLLVAAVVVVGLRLMGGTPLVQADITFTIALDADQRTRIAYNVGGYPTTFLVDEEGVIRGMRPGAFLNEAALLAWLGDISANEATSPSLGIAPRIGYTAPEFALPTLEGGTVVLSELRGKWVLINFWTTWCYYCVRQQPYLQAAFDKRGAEVEFIGINVGESEATVRRHIEG